MPVRIIYSVYPAFQYTAVKRGASSTRVVMPYNIKISRKRWSRMIGIRSLGCRKVRQKLIVKITRAMMIETGNTETRPRSVIRPTSTEGSERDHSTMAAKGSTTPVISLKCVTICGFIGSRDVILSGSTDLILLLAFYKPASFFWLETVCPLAETHRTTYLQTLSFSH